MAIMALIGGLSSIDAFQIDGPHYWDNLLLGFSPATGKYNDEPVGEFLNQVNDYQSAPDYANNLELIQQEGYPGVTFEARRPSLQQHAGKPTQDWNFESLRHMGKTADYK